MENLSVLEVDTDPLMPQIRSPIVQYGSSTLDTIEEELEVLSDKSSKWYSRPSVVFIYVTYFCSMVSQMTFAVQEAIYFEKACNTNMINGSCSAIDNQMLVSNYNQVSNVIFQITAVIGMSRLGKLSDTYGRKPMVVLIFLVYTVASVFTVLVLSKSDKFKFKTLILLGIIKNSFGGPGGLLSVGHAYIADITPKERLPTSLSFAMAMNNIGALLGTFVSKVLIEIGKTAGLSTSHVNYLPFFGQIIVLGLSLIFSFFIVESKNSFIPRDLGSSLNFEFSLSSISNVFSPLKVLGLPDSMIPEERKHEGSRMRFQTRILVVALALSSITAAALPIVFLQYAIYKFRWDASELSNVIMILSFSSVIALSTILPWMSSVFLPKKLKYEFDKHNLDKIDFFMLLFGSSVDMLSCVGLALANNQLQVNLLLVLFGLDGGFLTTINSAITKFFPENKIGEAYVAINMLSVIVTCVGPVLFLEMFKCGLKHGLANIPFLIMGLIQCGVFGFLFIVKTFVTQRSAIHLDYE